MSVNSILRMRALEIEDELIQAVQEAGRRGLRFSEGADRLGLDYNHFYGAVHELAALGRVKVGRTTAGNINCVVMPDWEEPVKSFLTDKQSRVLEILCARVDANSIVQISRKSLGKEAGVKDPTFVLDRLDYKGFLKFICFGGPTFAATFKVYPEGNGPRGYSWRPLNHNRRLRD